MSRRTRTFHWQALKRLRNGIARLIPLVVGIVSWYCRQKQYPLSRLVLTVRAQVQKYLNRRQGAAANDRRRGSKMAAAEKKSVRISIAPEDFATLKNANYKLCFAKKVDDTYNVVWQSYKDYLNNCTFSWVPTYQLFGTNTFQTNITVTTDTDTVPIGLGQTADLDKNGALGAAYNGKGPKTGITMNNAYGPIHPGLLSYSVGPDGKAATTAIYVAEDQIVTGDVALTPVESVQVWFEQNIETSTMFSSARSKAVQIDLTSVNTAARRYVGGEWITPASDALLTASFDPFGILTIIASLTSQINVSQLRAQLLAVVQAVYHDIEVTINAPGGVQIVISFNARHGLTGARQAQTAALLSDPVTVDILCGLTLDTLASMGVGYTEFQAIPA
jgi:hypothetical protein